MPRAEKEEEEAREIFEVLDAQLRNDLPLILELRVPFLDPSFECMVSRHGWVERRKTEGHQADNVYAAASAGPHADAFCDGRVREAGWGPALLRGRRAGGVRRWRA